MLILPRRVTAGEPGTLAVLDVNGRLTPGAHVVFTTGAQVTTDATGRGMFTAPAAAGTVFASIQGRPGRVALTVVEAAQGVDPPLVIRSAPRFASAGDRFELNGSGFCNVADANRVMIAGQPGLVLAASSLSLVVLPPEGMLPGPQGVTLACGNRGASSITVTFVALQLQASAAPLAPRESRELLVRITGSDARLLLEARNLAPEIAELEGGNPVRATSSGGAENTARFKVTGRTRGSFLISIRLVPTYVSARP
jgi:hypothetical protein